MKYSRNDICWCGSGRKYKHCHLGREEKPKVPVYDAAKMLRKSYSKEYCCCPESLKGECSRKIVRAHTVPKSSSLKKIAYNNHLYHLKPDLTLTVEKSGLIQPTLIGVNRATTFSGFCGYHDKNIFSPLEDFNFEITQEQCFLLFYRAICFEYYQKKSFAWLLDEMRIMDQGRPAISQIGIQTMIDDFLLGVNTSLRDLEREKSIVDTMLAENVFSELKYYILKFKKPLDIMCSGNVYPEIDFSGNQLIDLSDVSGSNNSYSISSFADGDEGIFAFVWLEQDDDLIIKFVQSLDSINTEEMPHYILNYLFEFVGNLVINPEWWDSIDSDDKSILCNRISSGASMSNPRESNCLEDDGLRINNWEITEKITNAW